MARGNIPFIAALHGATLGGGLETAAAAHIRVADETTYFGLPEGTRGIFIGGGGSVRVARLIGFARMQDMMLTGRVLKADEAERYGIVQYVVAKGQQIAKAKELAAEICKNAPLSNFAITNSLPRLQDMNYDDGLFFRTHGGGIHTQPGIDRAAAPIPRQDRAARAADRISEHGAINWD